MILVKATEFRLYLPFSMIDFEPNEIPFDYEADGILENCHCDHIPFLLEGTKNIILRVYGRASIFVNKLVNFS